MLWTSLLLFEETLLYADSSVYKVHHHYFESFIFEIFYGCQRFLFKIMSELCIACYFPVEGRKQVELTFVCQPCVLRIPPRDDDGVEVFCFSL